MDLCLGLVSSDRVFGSCLRIASSDRVFGSMLRLKFGTTLRPTFSSGHEHLISRIDGCNSRRGVPKLRVPTQQHQSANKRAYVTTGSRIVVQQTSIAFLVSPRLLRSNDTVRKCPTLSRYERHGNPSSIHESVYPIIFHTISA